jgi:hypothetical protein
MEVGFEMIAMCIDRFRFVLSGEEAPDACNPQACQDGCTLELRLSEPPDAADNKKKRATER